MGKGAGCGFFPGRESGVGSGDQSLVGVDGRLEQACEFSVGGLQALSQICPNVRWPTHENTQKFDTSVHELRSRLFPCNHQYQAD